MGATALPGDDPLRGGDTLRAFLAARGYHPRAMSDIPEALVGTVSGTIGDTVYGRNQFGPWTRPVNTPFDPMTTEQKLADDPLPWPEHEPFPVDSE